MSTLTLYRTHLTPSKNALVDELSTYLADCITYGPVEIQYQKPALDLAIKLTIPQAQLTRQDIGNYAALKQDNMTFYYFIMSAAWKSANTVEVTLSIDSINTFNGYIRFSNKTTVIRQHENRFNNIQPITWGEELKTYRLVDNVDEGINPIKIKSYDGKITDPDTLLNQTWYLVYRTPDEINSTAPIECLLMPTKNNIKYAQNLEAIKWYVSDFDLDVYYYWLGTENLNGACTIATGSTINSYNIGTDCEGLIFHRISDNFYAFVIKKTDSTLTISPISYLGTSSIVTWTRSTRMRRGNVLTADLSIVTGYTSLTHQAGTAQYLTTINTLDRTQSTLLKIIECPYCPVNLNFNSSNVLTVPDGWTITASGILKLTNPLTEFGRTLSNTVALPLQLTIGADSATDFVHMDRDIKYESKLYNSAFYTYKFVYDSFSTELQFENIIDYTIPLLSIQYKQANTITSDCGFKVDSTGALEYKNTGDYDMYILSTRNNESPIYTNEYLNYIRTGYNYDRKNQVQSNTSTWIGAAASVVGAVASGFAAAGTGGLSVVAAISLGTTAVTTLANSVINTISAEQSIQQKLSEAKAQASQVSGSNDINLLNWYSGNKLHIMTYQATDKMREQLWDLFHYCGYARNIQEKPNFTSRYWFNYVQCNLDDADVDSNPILNNYVDDIKSRWSAGVTIYHCHDGEYDWAQQYENWETAFIN